jgi:hypothetical protein
LDMAAPTGTLSMSAIHAIDWPAYDGRRDGQHVATAMQLCQNVLILFFYLAYPEQGWWSVDPRTFSYVCLFIDGTMVRGFTALWGLNPGNQLRLLPCSCTQHLTCLDKIQTDS